MRLKSAFIFRATWGILLFLCKTSEQPYHNQPVTTGRNYISGKDAPNNGSEEIIAEQPLASNTAYLRVQVRAPGAQCAFSYSEDGQNFKSIGKPFMAQPDKWVGAKVGVFALAQPGFRSGG